MNGEIPLCVICSYQNVDGLDGVREQAASIKTSGCTEAGRLTGSQGVIVVFGNSIGIPLRISF